MSIYFFNNSLVTFILFFTEVLPLLSILSQKELPHKSKKNSTISVCFDVLLIFATCQGVSIFYQYIIKSETKR